MLRIHPLEAFLRCGVKSSADSELIGRLRAGEEGAVADLVRAHGARVYQMAFRYLKNAEDAEELSQDVLFKAVDKIGEFRGDSALSSWLYRITFNAAMSRLRQLTRRPRGGGVRRYRAGRCERRDVDQRCARSAGAGG